MTSDPKFDRRIDDQLRAVPLPEGFMERLRHSILTDKEVDQEVRRVPIPRGLVERLQLSIVSDEELDAALKDVPVPDDLTDRLLEESLDNEGLDAAVCDVRIPDGLVRYARRGKLPWSGWASLRSWSAPVAILLMLVISFFGLFGIVYLGVFSPTSLPGFSQQTATNPPSASKDRAPKPTTTAQRGPKKNGNAKTDTTGAIAKKTATESPEFVPEEDVELLGSNLVAESPTKSETPVTSNPWGIFGADPRFDDVPELKKVAGLTPRGMDWPLVPGANRPFLIRYGVHPFVTPTTDPQLSSMTVPLAVTSESYELAKRYAEDGELPPPDLVRTEEFLAAMNYDFPRPSGNAPDQALQVSIAAGPSPFRSSHFQMIQIGVQAADISEGPRRPAHVILAIDASASMAGGSRLSLLKSAVQEWVSHLQPNDRLSLVVIREGATVQAEFLDATNAPRFVHAVEALRPAGSTNLGAGLSRAYDVAAQHPASDSLANRVVLLTDGLAGMDADSAKRITHYLKEAVRHNIHLDVIDLGREKDTDPQLKAFAEAGGGTLHRARGSDQIRWALLESLTGKSQLVARNALLKVTFDPRTVASYRLLGHEAKAVAGLMPQPPQADFFAGQSATALYEVQLKPGSSSPIATVELTWQDSNGNGEFNAASRIGRGKVAGTFQQSPPSLQLAALAAETAEVLRESPFARQPSKSVLINQILTLSSQVDSRYHDQERFHDFLTLLEELKKAKPARGTVRR